MGQKTNPTIFRLGKTKKWKSKYIEKKSPESALYAFRDLEIRKFINKILKDKGLLIHNCQLRYLENELHIFLSYCITAKALATIKIHHKGQGVKLKLQKTNFTENFREKYFTLEKKLKRYVHYQRIIENCHYTTTVKKYLGKKQFSKGKIAIKKSHCSLKYRRARILPRYKVAWSANKYQNISVREIKMDAFWNCVSKSISFFTNSKLDIFLNLKQLNKPTRIRFTKIQIRILKKIIGQLRKYKHSAFFEEGINLILEYTLNSQPSNLLAEFVANELRKQKRHNFFLGFIKSALHLLNNNIFVSQKNIKLMIKGRFNGTPRAKKRVMIIGKGVSVLSIKSNLDYAETVSYTSNGTFGVKIWTCEKTSV
jgi:ribosomal protein S3|uniref:Ribosomal protein S3 n=1 Tax=Phaeodactylum tricornutum TaxID=2850 RepID=F1DGP8_PHATR|nr:ribosomal protein S3 [Phaeodactylum tricornutum]ADY18526.1 ribosomal protein S3 [Phaeodactylum tricornutum]